MKKSLLAFLLSFLLLTLTACSMVPPSDGTDYSPTASGVNSSSADVRHANDLLRQGKKLEAASAYYRAASKQPSPQRERLILQAAEIATYVKDKSLARHYLSKIDSRQLDNENRARRSYVLALIELIDNHYQAALNILPQQRGNISAGLWNKIYRIRQQLSSKSNGQSQPSSFVLPQSINKVAVLLPLTGKLSSLSQVILKGINDSQQTIAPNTQIKTYDVANNNTVSQYQRAVAEGADIIIGPLDKRKIEALSKQAQSLVRPIVSLNHLNAGQGSAPAALYQYGLAPEDEARQVAAFANSRGQRRAALLYPDSSWGQRLSNAFKQMYRSQGGQIVAEVAYPNSAASYKAQVKQLLSMGAGNIDMIFLAASPSQARMIRPMIQHLNIGDTPVYATSHIYSGLPDAGQNMDLDGIIYTEIPYILENSQLGAITHNTIKYPRLYAMGADALLVALNLNRMVQGRKTLQGKTGLIRIDGNRFLQRKLALATFINGLTMPYGE